LKGDLDWNLSLQLDPGGERRPKDAKACLRFGILFSNGSGSRWDGEFLHVKGIGAMGVEHLRRSDVVLADDRSDARESEFELLRIRRSGNEQAGLRGAGAACFREHVDFLDGSPGRLRLQAEAEKFQQRRGILRRNRQVQGAGECSRQGLSIESFTRGRNSAFKRGLQLERYVDRGNGQGSRGDAHAQLLKKPAQKKRERFQIVDGVIQFEPFLKANRTLREE
jgi:hypothetical protein